MLLASDRHTKYPNVYPVLLSTWEENPKLRKNNVYSISHIYNVNIECNIDFQTVLVQNTNDKGEGHTIKE